MKHSMKNSETAPTTASKEERAKALQKKWAAYSHLLESKTQMEREAENGKKEQKLPPGVSEDELKKRKVNYEGEIILSSGIFYLFTVRNPESKCADGTSITVENSEGTVLDNLDKKLKERSKLEI